MFDIYCYKSHYQKFDIPDSWKWVTLESVCSTVTDGDHQAPPKSKEGVPFLVISDVISGKINYDNCRFVPENYYNSISDERKPIMGDILFTVTGSYGVPIQVLNNSRFCFQRHIGLLRPIIIGNWLYWFLQSNYCKKYCDLKATGTAQKTVGLQSLRELSVPIPPYTEQLRIIQHIRLYDDLIGQISDSKRSIREAVSSTKSKILDLAMQGKLVPQDPTDEPAADMLKRINPKARIITDNPHYPMKWAECQLGDLLTVISGVSYNKEDIVSGQIDSIRILRGGNIQDGNLIIQEDDIQVTKKCAGEFNNIQVGDTIMVASTGSMLAIGKTAYISRLYEDTYIGSFLRILRPRQLCLSHYLGYFFQSSKYKNEIQRLAKGSNINNIKASYITGMNIGLPPINEQKKIVAKIEELYAVLDEIEASLQS